VGWPCVCRSGSVRTPSRTGACGKSAVPGALVMHVVHVLRSQVLQILTGVDVLGAISSIFASLGRGTSSLSVLKQHRHPQAPLAGGTTHTGALCSRPLANPEHTGTRRLHFQEVYHPSPLLSWAFRSLLPLKC